MPLITGLLTVFILFFPNDLPTGLAVGTDSRPAEIRTVPLDTLSDLAVAFADPIAPVIYFSPRLMRRFGPEISAFVIVHEHAHIMLGHQRPSGAMSGEEKEQLLQRWELEADCLAAAILSRERPAAVAAARRHFELMGMNRVDREHPTGQARASRIELCSPSDIDD